MLTSDNLSGRTFGPYVSKAHYGLGTRIYQFGQHKLYYHGGLVRGYRTDLSYSSEKGLGLVVLLNAQSNLVAELSSFFWATMLDTQPQITPVKKRKKKVRKVAQQMEPFFSPFETDDPDDGQILTLDHLLAETGLTTSAQWSVPLAPEPDIAAELANLLNEAATESLAESPLLELRPAP